MAGGNVKAARAGQRSIPNWGARRSACAADHPKGHQRSLRDVADELAKLGFVNQRGAEFSASSIASIVE